MTNLNSSVIQAVSEFCAYLGISLQSVESQPRKVIGRLSCQRSLYVYIIDSDKLEFVIIDDLNTQTYFAQFSFGRWKFAVEPISA